MKRIFTLISSIAAALLLTVSCNKPVEPGTIAVFLGERNNYWETMANVIADAAYAYNPENVVKVTFKDEDGKSIIDAMNGLSKIDNLKGIIFAPTFDGAEEALADAARTSGVPIIVVDKFLDEKSPLIPLKCSQIFTSDKQEAVNLYNISRNNFTTNLLIFSSGTERSKERTKAAADMTDKATVVEIKDGQVSGQVAAALEEHPETDGVLIMDGDLVDDAVLDVLSGLKVYTFDISDVIYQGIANGKIVGAMVPDVDTIGMLAVQFVFNGVSSGASIVNAIYVTL